MPEVTDEGGGMLTLSPGSALIVGTAKFISATWAASFEEPAMEAAVLLRMPSLSLALRRHLTDHPSLQVKAWRAYLMKLENVLYTDCSSFLASSLCLFDYRQAQESLHLLQLSSTTKVHRNTCQLIQDRLIRFLSGLTRSCKSSIRKLFRFILLDEVLSEFLHLLCEPNFLGRILILF